MKFGENLYNLRKASKMSQEKLAEKVEVTRQSVSKWENGESYPGMDKIIKLCDIFHCKINDLVHEDMSDIDSLDEDIKMSVVKFKEEKQKKIKGISKAIYIIARIGKIILNIAIPILIFTLIVAPIFINNIELEDDTITFKGSKINDKITVMVDDKISLTEKTDQDMMNVKIKSILENNPRYMVVAYVEIGFLCLAIDLILYIMILNRLEKLFINIHNGDTPFTLENVKYIKEMAKFMIIVLALPTFGGIIFENILKTDLNVGIELFDVIQILFLFGISYVFEYGYELQLDSRGKMYGDENE